MDIKKAYLSLLEVSQQKQDMRAAGSAVENLFNIPDIDSQLMPLWPGEIMMVCGLPSNGKSFICRVMASNLADRMNEDGDPIVWVSTEESVEKIAAQMVARFMPQISYDQIARGYVDISSLVIASGNPHVFKLLGRPIHIIGRSMNLDSPYRSARLTLDYINDEIVKIEKRPSVIILDYLQKIDDLDPTSKEASVRRTVDSLRDMADRHKTVLVVASQAKFEVSRRQYCAPQLTDSEWSSNAGQTADIFIGTWILKVTHRPGNTVNLYGRQVTVDNSNLAVIYISKNKDGAMGTEHTVLADPVNLKLTGASINTINLNGNIPRPVDF